MGDEKPASAGVAVVIPCYNGGDTLGETLDSLRGILQEFEFETIVVDDGSTDPRTVQLRDDMDPRLFKLLRTPNRGLAAARNADIDSARGEFIIPLDADNLLRAQYLANGVDVLSSDPRLGVVYGHAHYFGERQGTWEVASFDLTSLALGNFINACALFRKSLWSDLGGYDERMPHMGWEDRDFWLRAAARGWGFHHLNEIAFDYRVRRGSMLEGTLGHADELSRHIFGKPSDMATHALREHAMASRRLKESKDYRVGRVIVEPARQVKRLPQRGTPGN
jgi:glycosyltransferase involved in cell wall biosynthesis